MKVWGKKQLEKPPEKSVFSAWFKREKGTMVSFLGP